MNELRRPERDIACALCARRSRHVPHARYILLLLLLLRMCSWWPRERVIICNYIYQCIYYIILALRAMLFFFLTSRIYLPNITERRFRSLRNVPSRAPPPPTPRGSRRKEITPESDTHDFLGADRVMICNSGCGGENIIHNNNNIIWSKNKSRYRSHKLALPTPTNSYSCNDIEAPVL